MKKFLILCLLTGSFFKLSAQILTVTGRVTDATTGEAVIGASIVVENTTNGVVSDADGKFSIRVDKPDAVLICSLWGMPHSANC
ncbi:MAG: carboxypeptidase-like regulatory domain-containing protein [Bacteroidales bacterium]